MNSKAARWNTSPGSIIRVEGNFLYFVSFCIGRVPTQGRGVLGSSGATDECYSS
jgi:hypothetical protein